MPSRRKVVVFAGRPGERQEERQSVQSRVMPVKAQALEQSQAR